MTQNQHSVFADALQGALSCDHKWKMNTHAETECEECGTVERWEGGMLMETTHLALTGLVEQKETLLAAVAEYVRVVKEHADALADYAEDMDGDAEQIVSSLGFIGNLDRGCLDPEEDSLAQALDVLRDSFPAIIPNEAAPELRPSSARNLDGVEASAESNDAEHGAASPANSLVPVEEDERRMRWADPNTPSPAKEPS